MNNSNNRNLNIKINISQEEDFNKIFEELNKNVCWGELGRICFYTGVLYYFDIYGSILDKHEHPVDFLRRSIKEAIKNKEQQND